jgi:alkylated DNA nucleotide flippase Atl1
MMTGHDSTDAVRALLEEVPTGKVVTYGDLADAVGLGPRQVGQILARSGHDLAWWRVVDAGGHPPKDAEETAAQHYKHEGISFHRAGNRVIVDLSNCRWHIQPCASDGS